MDVGGPARRLAGGPRHRPGAVHSSTASRRALIPRAARVAGRLPSRADGARRRWAARRARRCCTTAAPLIRVKGKRARGARASSASRASPASATACRCSTTGSVLDVANVIWCTGFHPGFSWIDLPVFDADGEPVHDGGVVPAAPGLYFVGLHFLYAMSSAMIHGVGRDAKRIVDDARRRARPRTLCGRRAGSRLRAWGRAGNRTRSRAAATCYARQRVGGGLPLVFGRGQEGAAAGRRPGAVRAVGGADRSRRRRSRAHGSPVSALIWTAASRPRAARCGVLAGVPSVGAAERWAAPAAGSRAPSG